MRTRVIVLGREARSLAKATREIRQEAHEVPLCRVVGLVK